MTSEPALQGEQNFDPVAQSDNEKAWHNARGKGIGASEIAIILGESEWASILELYYDKTGEYDRDEGRQEDEWLLWGRKLEGEIISELCSRAGVEIASRGTLLRSRLHHWALATPDAMTTAGEPVETKNIAWGYEADEWAEQIPEKYYLQCQQQMLVTGADRCLFGALLWGSRLIWEWVPRDEVAIDRIVAGGSKFWGHVTRREPPLSDGHKGARKVLGRLAVVDSELELFENEISDHLVDYENNDFELKRLRKREREIEKKRNVAADAIAQRMGSHRKAFTATGWSFTWSTVEKRGFTVEPTKFEKFKLKPPRKTA
jgi:putative phage-type endonuclease